MKNKNHKRVYRFKVGQTVLTKTGLEGIVRGRYGNYSPCYVVRMTSTFVNAGAIYGGDFETNMFCFAEHFLTDI